MWLFVKRVVISNYRCLDKVDLSLNPKLNIIVGNNECGKSTLLEAIHLALSGQLNGRPITGELHPHLFNAELVETYIASLRAKTAAPIPEIFIELYFPDDPALAAMRGTHNHAHVDATGVALSITFNRDYTAEYASYIADPDLIRTLPIEYYQVRWRSFAGHDVTARSIPIKPSFIDASTIRNNVAASRYVIDIMRDSLTRAEKVDLALSYRQMKDLFLDQEKVKGVNAALAAKKGAISDKALSVALDTSSRAGWETGVMPHLDAIPLPLVGKGEQNTIKIKLAMEASAESHLIQIEEPENHLSFSNLNALIDHIGEQRAERQLVITTHSSFVLNKLGMESVILFNRGRNATLKDLPAATQDYFMRLPGHDTLRLILAERTILVEGPSDELVVQAAFQRKHGKPPLAAGVDVISVGSLAFKRFLDIALLIGREVAVVTDNDGDLAALAAKYRDYDGKPSVAIHYDTDVNFRTLEPQLLKANGRAVIEAVLGKAFADDDALLTWMKANKADAALAFFKTAQPWTAPAYIQAALG